MMTMVGTQWHTPMYALARAFQHVCWAWASLEVCGAYQGFREIRAGKDLDTRLIQFKKISFKFKNLWSNLAYTFLLEPDGV